MSQISQKSNIKLFLVLASLLFLSTVTFAGDNEPEQQIPVPGMVTMVDLGAKKCVPCKMMAPILVELEEEYRDRAAILFIDVWDNPKAARTFGVGSIPTQIFYNSEGKEMSRHVGFFDKASIIKELQKLDVK